MDFPLRFWGSCRKIVLMEIIKACKPALLCLLFIGLEVPCPTQAQSETNNAWDTLILVSPVPAQGVFFSMQRRSPPSPVDPFPNLDLYTENLSSGAYFYDDRGVDYSSWRTSGGLSAADLTGPPVPGGTNGSGSGSPSGTPSVAPPTFTFTDDCHDWKNFWLVISNTGTAALVGIAST